MIEVPVGFQRVVDPAYEVLDLPHPREEVDVEEVDMDLVDLGQQSSSEEDEVACCSRSEEDRTNWDADFLAMPALLQPQPQSQPQPQAQPQPQPQPQPGFGVMTQPDEAEHGQSDAPQLKLPPSCEPAPSAGRLGRLGGWTAAALPTVEDEEGEASTAYDASTTGGSAVHPRQSGSKDGWEDGSEGGSDAGSEDWSAGRPPPLSPRVSPRPLLWCVVAYAANAAAMAAYTTLLLWTHDGLSRYPPAPNLAVRGVDAIRGVEAAEVSAVATLFTAAATAALAFLGCHSRPGAWLGGLPRAP
jgi:hypothetical protein